jgi:hypothetical protein
LIPDQHFRRQAPSLGCHVIWERSPRGEFPFSQRSGVTLAHATDVSSLRGCLVRSVAVVTRVAVLLAALVALGTLAACGSSHAQPYTGRLYSVTQVQKAFASLGLELHRVSGTDPGTVELVNDRHLGPQHIPSPPRVVTVVLLTRRDAAPTTPVGLGSHRVMRYANATVYVKAGAFVLDEARGAISALRWGTFKPEEPGKRLIVLGDSIGDIRLGESRRNVEKALGMGRAGPSGSRRYFGGRLVVGYEFHDRIYNFVTYVRTSWDRYRVARSGIHVGSTRRDLRRLYVDCYDKVNCILEAGPWPDPLGSWFTVRHGKVTEIYVGNLA